MWLVKNSFMNAWRFQCEIEKKWWKPCHFLNQNFLYWEIFNAFYLLMTHLMVTYFLIFILTLPWHSPFLFYMCDKHSVIISKVHYESTFVLKTHPHFLIQFSPKSIAKWIIQKLTMLMLHMVLHFKFIYNLKKLWLWQYKLNISLCFPHTMSFIIFIQMKLNFHKINSFFSSIDRLITASGALQHKAQVNLQWVEKRYNEAVDPSS
jgi:hypothetical protein